MRKKESKQLWKAWLTDSTVHAKLLIVSESTDKTDDIVTEFSKNSAVIKLLTSNKRLGKGGAFKKGVRECSRAKL